MDITPQVPRDAQVIQRYGPGRFTIAGETYRGSVLVTPIAVAAWPAAGTPDQWQETDLRPIHQLTPLPELLLVGTGSTMALLPKALRVALKARGIGCDVMDTGAACRTYNILLAEGRRVAAVLVAVD
jgi:uncharacterized protein